MFYNEELEHLYKDLFYEALPKRKLLRRFYNTVEFPTLKNRWYTRVAASDEDFLGWDVIYWPDLVGELLRRPETLDILQASYRWRDLHEGGVRSQLYQELRSYFHTHYVLPCSQYWLLDSDDPEAFHESFRRILRHLRDYEHQPYNVTVLRGPEIGSEAWRRGEGGTTLHKVRRVHPRILEHVSPLLSLVIASLQLGWYNRTLDPLGRYGIGFDKDRIFVNFAQALKTLTTGTHEYRQFFDYVDAGSDDRLYSYCDKVAESLPQDPRVFRNYGPRISIQYDDETMLNAVNAQLAVRDEYWQGQAVTKDSEYCYTISYDQLDNLLTTCANTPVEELKQRKFSQSRRSRRAANRALYKPKASRPPRSVEGSIDLSFLGENLPEGPKLSLKLIRYNHRCYYTLPLAFKSRKLEAANNPAVYARSYAYETWSGEARVPMSPRAADPSPTSMLKVPVTRMKSTLKQKATYSIEDDIYFHPQCLLREAIPVAAAVAKAKHGGTEKYDACINQLKALRNLVLWVEKPEATDIGEFDFDFIFTMDKEDYPSCPINFQDADSTERAEYLIGRFRAREEEPPGRLTDYEKVIIWYVESEEFPYIRTANCHVHLNVAEKCRYIKHRWLPQRNVSTLRRYVEFSHFMKDLDDRMRLQKAFPDNPQESLLLLAEELFGSAI